MMWRYIRFTSCEIANFAYAGKSNKHCSIEQVCSHCYGCPGRQADGIVDIIEYHRGI
jgi:hypothetical protein